MNKMKFFTGAVLTFSLLLWTACQKDKDEDLTDTDIEMVSDSDVAEIIFDEIVEISDQAYESFSGNNKSTDDEDIRLGNCVTITIDTTVMPRVMTIDFGEVNCLCRDGKWRRGQIIVTFTGPYHQVGTVKQHTFNNFFVNDNQVEGTKTQSNLGPNQNGHPEFSTVINGTLTLANNGGIITWQSEHLRTWVEGYTTRRVWIDDVFLITGSGSHTHSNGGGFTRTIIEPLRKELSCHHFVSGIVQTVPVNRPARTLDYGDGSCDNIASLTIGGRTRIIRLR